MASPNVGEIVATTISSRRRKTVDNYTKNNALYSRLSERGNIETFSGGDEIKEEIVYAENSNTMWYNGYDILSVGPQQVIDAASYPIRQLATAVIISGLEELQNSGREKMIDLITTRVKNAEGSITNKLGEGVYADGTGYGGKTISGLAAAVPVDPTTGTYGAINRASFTFWRPQLHAPGSLTSSSVQAAFNAMWAKLVRGSDRPDLIPTDNNLWATFIASLQPLQRFTDAKKASLGFPSVDFFGADVVLDGGIGGFCPANSAWFLNTKYIRLRPHKDRNIVPLNPDRQAINQDATVKLIAWAGNMTVSNSSLQGFLKAY